MGPQSVSTWLQKQNLFRKKNDVVRIFAISYSACGNYRKSLISVTDVAFAISHLLESDMFVQVNLCSYMYSVDLA